MGKGRNAGNNAGSSTMKATRVAVTRGSMKAGPGPLTSAAANANAKTARKQSDQAAKSSKERAAGKQI